jgi:hypothetical protein
MFSSFFRGKASASIGVPGHVTAGELSDDALEMVIGGLARPLTEPATLAAAATPVVAPVTLPPAPALDAPAFVA